MKNKIRNFLFKGLFKASGDDLEFTKREKVMIKWFIKFELSVILIIFSWIMPAKAIIDHYYEYKDLQTRVSQLSIKTKSVEAKEETKEVAATVIDRDPEEEYHHLLETNEEFRTYIDTMRVNNNNPCNLVFANQPNARANGRFASFPDIRTGFRACIKQVELDQSRNLSIDKFFHKFSPDYENDTESIISGCEDYFSVDRDTNIANLNNIKLTQYIVFRENSIKYETNTRND